MNKIKKLFITILNIFRIYNKSTDCVRYSEDCIVFGNGPSLNKSINKDKICLNIDKVCVNFFALSQYYGEIAPKHYFISDPFFFEDKIKPLSKIEKSNKIYQNENIKKLIIEDYNYLEKKKDELIECLNLKTNWNMTLHLPIHYCGSMIIKKITNSNIKINYFSQIPLGIKMSNLRNILYRSRLFMPLPQNILIATIAGAVRLGYRKIYIVGADHSWHEDFVLNNDNILGINDKHFYDHENSKEGIFKPLISDYETGKLTSISNQFYAQYLVFKSHDLLQNYAQSVGVEVINMSEKSYIDAYMKSNLKEY